MGTSTLAKFPPRKEILQELAAPVASCRCRCSLIAGSHTTSKFMLIRGGQKLGENYLPEKLELEPFMNCTMGRVDDVCT